MTTNDTEDAAGAAGRQLVGPILRAGTLADAVIDAVTEDNPGRALAIVDRDDYVRIHTAGECILRRDTLAKHLGEPFELARLEVEMPSFAGRMETRTDAYRWYYAS